MSLRDVAKNYGRVCALDGVTFSVERGECVAMVGPNGAGKTTVFRVLSGLIRNFSGEAMIGGADVKARREPLGALIEQPAFYPYLTPRENLSYLSGFGNDKKISEILTLVGLRSHADKRSGRLSHGQRQRLGLGIALISQGTSLLLDEPLTGLDPPGQMEMRAIIADQARNERAILLSTHILSDVESVADRVVFIKNGAIVAVGDLEDLRKVTGVLVKTSRPQETMRVLAKRGYSCKPHETNEVLITGTGIASDEIISFLSSEGLPPKEVNLQRVSLEEIYMRHLGDP